MPAPRPKLPAPPPEAEAYLGLAALSRIAGLSVRTLRDRIHDAIDPIPAFRIGGAGKLLVRRSEFDAWMSRRRFKPETVDAIVADVLGELAGRSA
jgi:hypothetical protein